ncbi:hypothetical protein PD885_02290 [Xanthomonas fragariae]|uniref:Transposase InsH N-terminal domain-containing protein n=2 Tax=Xanthomonas fragariae TaxID=48664 RepID=A0ABY1RQF9_9XANT|nr:hypothetical protein PD885_02290 [Xanthomonas fragariae]
MPWAALEQALSRHFPATAAAGGRPALPVRLIAGLLYLKHAYDLSDEAVCERWLENPYWQFFTGEVVFQTRLPCDPSSLTRWRQRLGEAGMEELLAHTINAVHVMKAVDAREVSRVIVDTTVQEKAIAYPTHSRLLEVARKKLVLLAKRYGSALRQSDARQGPALSRFARLGCLDNVPDETTILNFRSLLETHGLAVRMLEAVNAHLVRKGQSLRSGMIVDATLIAAPTNLWIVRR